MKSGRLVWWKDDRADVGEVVGVSHQGVIVRWEHGTGTVDPKMLCWETSPLAVSKVKRKEYEQAKRDRNRKNFENRHLKIKIGDLFPRGCLPEPWAQLTAEESGIGAVW